MGEMEENCLFSIRRIKIEKHGSDDEEKRKTANTKKIKIKKNVVRSSTSATSSDEEVHRNKAKRNKRVISEDSDSSCQRDKQNHGSYRRTMERDRRNMKKEMLAEPKEKHKLLKKKGENINKEDKSSENSSEKHSSLSDEAGSRSFKRHKVANVRGWVYMLKAIERRKKKDDVESEGSSPQDSSSSDEELQRTKRKIAKKTCKGRKNKEDNEIGSSSPKDSSSSDEEVPPSKNHPIKKKKNKGKVKKKDTESDRSSPSSNEEVIPYKKRPVIMKKNKARVDKKDTESEKSSPEDSSLSDEEVENESSSSNDSLSDEEISRTVTKTKKKRRHEKEELSRKKSKVIKAQRDEGKQKADIKGSQKQTFQRRKNASQRNCLQKPFDDTLTESNVKALSQNMKSIGALVSCGNLVGTVFSVGDKYVFTAYHVIIRIPEEYRFENKETFANFNESPYTQPDVAFTFKRLAFFDEPLDFAILEVSNPESLPNGLKISKVNCGELGVSRLSIIGYGHPDQPKKTLDPGCVLIEPGSTRIFLAKQWLETNRSYHQRILAGTGHAPRIADFGFGNFDVPSKFVIDCFMEQGVSGAPALVACGYNGRMEVSGLVTHGIPEFFYLLPKLVTLAMFPREHRFASGTTMNAIYNSIRKADKKLANVLFN